MKETLNDKAWQEASELLGMKEAEIKEKVKAADFQNPVKSNSGDQLSPQIADGKGEVKVPFEIGFFDILAVKGEATFTSGAKWAISTWVGFYVLGKEIVRETFELNYNQYEKCFGIDVGFAYLNICFGVRSEHICLYIKGEAGIWNIFTGWTRAKFDENIVCFNP